MRHPIGLGLALMSLTMTLAACGGSSAATPAASAPTQGPTATNQSDGGTETGAPTGGAALVPACSLITAAEAAGVMSAVAGIVDHFGGNVGGMRTEAVEGGQGTSVCTYFAGDLLLFRTDIQAYPAAAYPESGVPGVIEIPGIGDGAAYASMIYEFMVRKGSAMTTIAINLDPGTGAWLISEQVRVDLSKKLGVLAASRM